MALNWGHLGDSCSCVVGVLQHGSVYAKDKDGGGEVSVKEFDRAMRAAEKLPSKKERQAHHDFPRSWEEIPKEKFSNSILISIIFCLFDDF